MKNHNNKKLRITSFLIMISMFLLSASSFAEITTKKLEGIEEKPSETAGIKTPQSEQKQPLLYRYIAALKQTIRKNWNTNEIHQPFRCEVVFTQIPGGDVTSVSFSGCPDDKQARQSIEKALLKEPMPYLGFEYVFQRKIAMTLCQPEKSCN